MGRFTEMRGRLTRLSVLQKELRQEVAQTVSGYTLAQCAQLYGVEWSTWQRYWNEGRPVFAGKLLAALCEGLRRDDLRKSIVEEGESLPDRYKGLAACSIRAIDLVFDLLDVHETVAERFTFEQFARLFEPRTAEVYRAMNGIREAAVAFDDESFEKFVKERLAAIDWKNVEAPGPGSEQEALFHEFERLFAEVRKSYQADTDLATALGFNRTTITHLKQNKAGRKTFEAAVKKLRSLATLRKEVPMVVPPPPVVPLPTSSVPSGDAVDRETLVQKTRATLGLLRKMYPTRRAGASAIKVVGRDRVILAMDGKLDDLEALKKILESAQALIERQNPASAMPPQADLGPDLLGFAGETSPLGVRYVLGPDSFRPIELMLGPEFIAYTKKLIEATRALLNVACQIKNEELRGKVRTQLGAEVEELELALRAFTAQHPNRLTRLHQAQRETWAGLRRQKE